MRMQVYLRLVPALGWLSAKRPAEHDLPAAARDWSTDLAASYKAGLQRLIKRLGGCRCRRLSEKESADLDTISIITSMHSPSPDAF